MTGTYDLRLVALSIAVACLAAYTALELAARLTSVRGRAGSLWLVGGAFAMGTGIWSMHFIAMLAFRLPIPLAYDVSLNALSWVIAMLVSGLALHIVRRPALTANAVSVGATLMGVGIASMHYTGMASMQMSPPISYDPPLFIASVLIAIVASLAALCIAFRLRKKSSPLAVLAKLGAGLVMGFAIAGMHYTGMAAAHFAPDSVCLAAESLAGIGGDTLALLVGVGTFAVLAITLAISALDAHFSAHTARLARSLQAANDQLRSIALYDELTGLPNRALLYDRLDHALARGKRSKTRFAVLFLDLDKFKAVNDRMGHAAGDEVLKNVATRLSQCVRSTDTVARNGGDEFVVVLSELESRERVSRVATKILGEVARPMVIAAESVEIGCSIGVSFFPDDGESIAGLIAHADLAMYSAKKSGRNTYQCFEPRMLEALRP